MSKPNIEALECYDNCFEALEKASALVEAACSLSDGFRNLDPQVVHHYFITINDQLNQLKTNLIELNNLLKPETT